MRGALKFIDDDLPRALVERRRPAPARRSRRRADRGVAGGRRVHRRISKPRSRPKARALVPARPRQVRAEAASSTKGIAVPVDRLLAIATRELKATQEAFKSAGRPHERRRSARGVGADQGASIRRRASWSTSAASSSTSSRRSSSGRRSSRCRRGEPITVAPTPEFYRWSFASMWTPGPFESKPTRAYYYLTDVDPSWSRRAPGRAPARLQLPDALVDLDPRGLPGAFPAVPAPAPRRIEGRASRSCSRRRRSSKAGRTTASR